MKGRTVLGVMLICCLAGPAIAGPFAEVARGHLAYREAAILDKAGVLRPSDSQLLSSGRTLTRYDFALLALDPLSAIDAVADGSAALTIREKAGVTGQTALAQALQTMGGEERRRLGRAIVALAREFDDVLRLISEDYKSGLEAAYSLASTGSPGVRRSERNPGPGAGLSPLRSNLLGAKLALTYRRSGGDSPPFEYVAALRLASPPGEAGAPRAAISGRPSLSDLGMSAVGGSVEYGLSGDLRVSLGYEALLTEGSSALTADLTRLKTVGLAYRLSGSTDVRLRYQLIERREAPNVSPLEARLAATELTVRF